MITYNYVCTYCGYVFEIQQSIKDHSLKKCKKCNMITLSRVMTGGIARFVKHTKTPVKMD